MQSNEGKPTTPSTGEQSASTSSSATPSPSAPVSPLPPVSSPVSAPATDPAASADPALAAEPVPEGSQEVNAGQPTEKPTSEPEQPGEQKTAQPEAEDQEQSAPATPSEAESKAAAIKRAMEAYEGDNVSVYADFLKEHLTQLRETTKDSVEYWRLVNNVHDELEKTHPTAAQALVEAARQESNARQALAKQLEGSEQSSGPQSASPLQDSVVNNAPPQATQQAAQPPEQKTANEDSETMQRFRKGIENKKRSGSSFLANITLPPASLGEQKFEEALRDSPPASVLPAKIDSLKQTCLSEIKASEKIARANDISYDEGFYNEFDADSFEQRASMAERAKILRAKSQSIKTNNAAIQILDKLGQPPDYKAFETIEKQCENNRSMKDACKKIRETVFDQQYIDQRQSLMNLKSEHLDTLKATKASWGPLGNFLYKRQCASLERSLSNAYNTLLQKGDPESIKAAKHYKQELDAFRMAKDEVDGRQPRASDHYKQGRIGSSRAEVDKTLQANSALRSANIQAGHEKDMATQASRAKKLN